jgi:iron complex outermembrane recepter protein
MRLRRKSSLALAAFITITAAPVARADDGRSPDITYAADGERRKTPISIEQLTVTARKREERLQEIPLAVSAFSGAELDDFDVRRLSDIHSLAPNLAFDATAEASSAARVYIRGVGNGDAIASDDPGVGIYLDGVYLARAQAGLFTLSDIERVEVLRGPQGTLFGKNAVGGAVNVITKKPTLDGFSSTAEVRIGNYDRFDTRLSANIPLVPERAAARVSFATATRDGFQKNKGAGPDLDDDKLLGVRAQLLAVPSDDFELMLALDGTRENRKPAGYKCKVVNRFGVLQSAQTNPELAVGSEFQGPPSAAIFAQQQGTGGGAAGLNNLISGANPFLDACAQDDRRDTRSVNSELSFQKEYLDSYGASLTANWNLSDSTSLRSITSLRGQEVDDARDVDATPFLFVTLDIVDAGKEEQSQLSQELQLSGRALGGKLSYTTGLFWFAEKATDDGFQGLGTGQTFQFPATPGTRFPLVDSVASLQFDRLKVDNYSYAAYGQGTYDLTDRLSFTLGARLTSERKRIERNIVCQGPDLASGSRCPAPQAELFFFDGSTRSKDVSPIGTLKYELSDAAQVYATWSRGFKSGGFNGRANSASLVDNVDDEKLTSYEVGFKSLFLDNRIRLNGAFFYSVYEDIQLSIPRGNPLTNQFETVVTNAGGAEIKGAELELRAIPFPGLELSSGLGVTNARYTEFDDLPSVSGSPLDPMIPDNPEDRLLVGTPTYTMNFVASYQFPIGSLGDLRARTDWTHTGRSGTDVVDSRILRKGKHGELDAQLAWMLNDGVTELVVFGSNLLDREYVVNGINLGASFGSAVLLYNAPRTYGLELRRSF